MLTDEQQHQLQHDYEWYARNHFRIVKTDGSVALLAPRPGQLKLYEAIRKQQLAGVPIRGRILKSRQIGFSTSAQQIICQRTTTRANHKAMTIAHDKGTAASLFNISKFGYEHLPMIPWLKPELASWSDSADRKYMHFGIPVRQRRLGGDMGLNSSLDVDTANEYESGRGLTINSLHACLTSETPVMVGDGRVIPICEVQIGDTVVTHNGCLAQVSAISAGAPSEVNGAGKTVRITPWLGGEIELTPNHKVWTERGWVEAGDLTKDDRLAMPVREIQDHVKTIQLPSAPKRKQGGGRRSIGSGVELELNEDVGFAFGYYLAEGSLNRNPFGPSAITFTRHDDENDYADRACEALAGVTTSRRTTSRVGNRTTEDVVYGSPLARAVEREFGAADNKHVPDWVFSAGKDFLRGLLSGYLCGDGSKTNDRQGKYVSARVSATTICSSIATQMRDVAASLGYGWASVTFKPGGDRYGRNCRDAWVVSWAGRAARGLRPLMGLAAPSGGRDRSEKTELKDGKLWMRIRSIDAGRTDLVWDLEIDHPDHSFRTLHFAVSNSETAFWKDPRKIRSAFNAVPDEPDSMILDESTANGHNHFKEQWDAADSGESSFFALFVGWWEEPMYASAFLNEDDRQDFIDNKLGRGEYGEDEEYLRDEFMCTPEQLLWRRKTVADRCENNVEIFHQEFPTTAEEAFIATGRTVYSKAMLRRLMATAKRLDPEPPAEPTAVEGIFKPAATTKRMDRTMQDRDVPTSALWVPKEATGFDQAHPYWRIFVPPREKSPNAVEGRYIVACDPAGDPSPDPKKTAAHAIQVIDHFTGEQVAELETWIDADLIADELLLVALHYNNAVIAVETTGGYGMSMVKKLAFDYWYPYMYAGKRLDGVKDDYERRLGWNTSRTSKKVLEDTMRETLRTDTHGIKSQRLAKQFFNYVDLGNGKTGAEKGKRVDGVMAYQIGQQIKLEEAPRPQMSDAVVVTSGRRGDPRTGW